MIAQIVAAYSARPDVTIDDITELTLKLSQGIGSEPATDAAAGESGDGPAMPASKPAIAIEDAVTDSKVYCLCCGKGFKMLKRHIRAEHGLSEEDYRRKFDLPDDFPLVAPDYSKMKANTAKKIGLGKYSRSEADPVS